MQKITILLTTILLCFTAQGKVSQPVSMSFQQLTQRFSEERGRDLPESIAAIPIENIEVDRKTIAFTVNKVRIRLSVLSTQPLKLDLNGQIFTADELKSHSAIQKNLMRKFNWSSQRVSFLDFLVPRLFADNGIPPLFPPSANTPSASKKPYTGLSTVASFINGNQMQQLMTILSSFIGTVQEFTEKDSVFSQFGNFGSPDDIPKPFTSI